LGIARPFLLFSLFLYFLPALYCLSLFSASASIQGSGLDNVTFTDGHDSRAKIKLLAKKSLETGEDIDSIPESMRQYLAMQAMESGKGFGGAFFGRSGLLPYGHGSSMLLGGDQSGQGKVCKYMSNPWLGE
jgi:hypothetical protein